MSMPAPNSTNSRLLVEATHELRVLLKAEPGTSTEIAERLGVNQSTIIRIINGADDYTPSPQMIEQLLERLGYEVVVTVRRR